MSKTAIVVDVPEAEPVVGRWRMQHTCDAPLGMPAHVTLLFPWVPVGELSEDTELRLARLMCEVAPFAVTFARTGRFPEVLYLEPQPSEPFAAFTAAIAAEWPEHPPYEGVHETVIPHLTVAESDDERLFELIRAEVEPLLPVETRVSEAKLFEEDSAGRWRERARMPLAASKTDD